MAEPSIDGLLRRLSDRGVVMLLGGVDTGKTTLARQIARAAVTAGRSAAIVDADVGNSMIGPPACVGLRVIRSPSDLDDLETPDRLHFVGEINPGRLVLQQVVATAALVEAARSQADVVVIDTSSEVSGVAGETLKYHKTELCRPDRIVAIQRGGELEPLMGMLRRFFGTEIDMMTASPTLIPSTPEERARRRAQKFAEALSPPLERWRVRPTVFAPTLPVGLDLGRLADILVGVQDSSGSCLGLGYLIHEDDGLRVATNVGEGMTGLRLGSITIDPRTYECRPARLREVMFGI